METSTNTESQLLFLSFRVLGEDYGLPISKVREIISLPPVTRLPQTPPFVRGLVNVRGIIVPILDLARFFGQEPAGATKDTCVVIVEMFSNGRERLFGLVADSVREVVELANDTVIEPSTFGDRARIACLSGLVPTAGGLLLLLDAERLLSAQQMLAFEQELDTDRAAPAAGAPSAARELHP